MNESVATASINMDDVIAKVFEELQIAENDVNTKTVELQAAREKLAMARGKLEMIGQLQRLAAA